MKNYIFVAFSMALVACASPQDSKTPDQFRDSRPEHLHSTTEDKQDNFDKAGVIFADGSRWSYNKALDAWEYVTSEESKQTAVKYLSATKKAVIDSYEATIKAYQDAK